MHKHPTSITERLHISRDYRSSQQISQTLRPNCRSSLYRLTSTATIESYLQKGTGSIYIHCLKHLRRHGRFPYQRHLPSKYRALFRESGKNRSIEKNAPKNGRGRQYFLSKQTHEFNLAEPDLNRFSGSSVDASEPVAALDRSLKKLATGKLVDAVVRTSG